VDLAEDALDGFEAVLREVERLIPFDAWPNGPHLRLCDQDPASFASGVIDVRSAAIDS
jgi:hypothetical protein